MLAAHFNAPEDAVMHEVEQFEQEVKKRFVEEPRRMKLLIVVDKLLTGFDAPPATYLYIDKQMRDHRLFQAICRVNRLHGEDKEYGYIIDYKDLFRSLSQAIDDYTGEAFDGYDAEDISGLLENRLQKARERLEDLREEIAALCEPVAPPRDTAAYLHFFCAAEGDPDQRKNDERKRGTLYKLVGSFLRAYANLANEMQEAGYAAAESAGHQRRSGLLRERARRGQTRQRRLYRPKNVRAGHAAPARRVHPSRRERTDLHLRQSDTRATDRQARGARARIPARGHSRKSGSPGRDYRKQCPANHHRRDGCQPQVLRENVGLARRPGFCNASERP